MNMYLYTRVYTLYTSIGRTLINMQQNYKGKTPRNQQWYYQHFD